MALLKSCSIVRAICHQAGGAAASIAVMGAMGAPPG